MDISVYLQKLRMKKDRYRYFGDKKIKIQKNIKKDVTDLTDVYFVILQISNLCYNIYANTQRIKAILCNK